MRHVERRAGMKFERIGAPQPDDIIKASARDATRSLDEVPAEVLPLFRDVAKVRLRGPTRVPAAAAAAAVRPHEEFFLVLLSN